MSLLIFESFDAPYVNGILVGSPWTTNAGGGFSVAGGRRATACMQINDATTTNYRRCTLAAEQSALVLGMAVKPTSSGGSYTGRFLDFKSAAAARQFVVDWTSAGRVRILDAPAGNILAQSADGAMIFDIYQYFEIKFTCDAGNGTVQVRVNGVDVIAETAGLNLKQSGSGGVLAVEWGAIVHTVNILVDDLYIENQSGASFNTFLGDAKVDVFLPTGDGNYQQFTSSEPTHHDAINVVGVSAPNEYIEEDTLGQKDSFTITPTGDLPTIYAIGIRNVARNSDTGVAEGTLFIRQGGVDYDQASFERGDTVEQDDQIFLVRPDTGGQWTKAVLETMEFGFEFSAAS